MRVTIILMLIAAMAVLTTGCGNGEPEPEDITPLSDLIEFSDEATPEPGTEPDTEPTVTPGPTPEPTLDLSELQRAGLEAMELAEELAAQGEHEKAAETFRDAIREKRAYEAQGIGQHPLPEQRLQTGLARALDELGFHHDALEHLERSLEADQSAVTIAEIAMQHVNLEQCGDAEEAARKVLLMQAIYERSTMIHTHAMAHHALALCQFIHDDPRSALENIEQAIGITKVFRNPTELEELRSRITSGGRDTGWKASLNVFARAALRRAEAHMISERYSLAAESYDEAIEAQERPSPELERGAGTARAMLEEHEQAIPHFTNALEFSRSSSLFLERARSYHATSRHQLALTDLRNAIELDAEPLPKTRSTHVEAHWLSAESRRAMGDPITAITDITNAIILAQGNGYPLGEIQKMEELYAMLRVEEQALRAMATPVPVGVSPTPAPTPIVYVSVLSQQFINDYDQMRTWYSSENYPEAALSAQTAWDLVKTEVKQTDLNTVPAHERSMLHDLRTTHGHAMAIMNQHQEAMDAYREAIWISDEPAARLGLAMLYLKNLNENRAMDQALAVTNLPNTSITLPGAPETKRSSWAEAGRILVPILRSNWRYRESLQYANFALTSAARMGLYTEAEMGKIRDERDLADKILQLAGDKAEEDAAEQGGS